VLADISFTAFAPGVPPLTLSNVFLNDLDSSSGFLTTNGQVTITGAAVPEPMTVTLLTMGPRCGCRPSLAPHTLTRM
jgi:hypothetical protein